MSKIDRKKLRTPPPLPPPPLLKPRHKKQVSANSCTLLSSLVIQEPANLSTLDTLELTLPPQIKVQESSPRKGATPISSNSSSPRYGAVKKEPNKYPPLFFTIRDFEEVVGESKADEETFFDTSDVPQCPDTELTEDEKSFVKSSLDDENNICFRVTTTSTPFEKCQEKWESATDGDLIATEDSEGAYMFDDYIDRTKRINPRPVSLFDSDTFDVNAVPRTATRVRFVIESPSTSTPDDNLDTEVKYLATSFVNINYEDNNPEPDRLQLVEITDDQATDAALSNVFTDTINDFMSKGIENLSLIDVPVRGEAFEADKQDNNDFLLERNFVTCTFESDNGNFSVESSANLIDTDNKNTAAPQPNFLLYDMKLCDITASPLKAVSTAIASDEKNGNNNVITVIGENSELVSNDVAPTTDDTQAKEEPLHENTESSNVRRNSFLEEMLHGDSTKSCQVIAAHVKSSVPIWQPGDTSGSNDLEKQSGKVQQSSDERRSSKSSVLSFTIADTGKSATEAKSDVLSELLSNFNTIKLKVVKSNDEPEQQSAENLTTTESTVIVAVPVIIEPTGSEEEKINIEEVKENTHQEAVVASETISPVEDKSVCEKTDNKATAESTSLISEDSSAIIIDETLNPKSDNKAMTMPVDLSKDQSAVTITPGSVKNLLKYYEIRTQEELLEKQLGEVHKFSRKTAITPKKEQKVDKGAKKTTNRKKEVVVSSPKQERLIKNEIAYTVVARKEVSKDNDSPSVDQCNSRATAVRRGGSYQSCLRSIPSEDSKATDPKKNVQFNSDCIVIRFNGSVGDGSNSSGGAQVKSKGEMPERQQEQCAASDDVRGQVLGNDGKLEDWKMDKSPHQPDEITDQVS